MIRLASRGSVKVGRTDLKVTADNDQVNTIPMVDLA